MSSLFLFYQVWVFVIKEGPPASRNAFKTFIMDTFRGANGGGLGLMGGGGGAAGGVGRSRGAGGAQQQQLQQPENRVFTDIYKFINAGSGVTAIKLHPDKKRMAVLLPLNQTVEVSKSYKRVVVFEEKCVVIPSVPVGWTFPRFF